MLAVAGVQVPGRQLVCLSRSSWRARASAALPTRRSSIEGRWSIQTLATLTDVRNRCLVLMQSMLSQSAYAISASYLQLARMQVVNA